MDLHLEQLEQLTKIHVPADERDAFAQSITKILAYISQLQQIPTKHEDALEHITPNVNVFRADEVITNSAEHEALVRAFPKNVAGLLEVPAVFE